MFLEQLRHSTSKKALKISFLIENNFPFILLTNRFKLLLVWIFFAYNKIGFRFKKWKWKEIVQHFANANEIKTRNAINRVCFLDIFLKWILFSLPCSAFLHCTEFTFWCRVWLGNEESYCTDFEMFLLKNKSECFYLLEFLY